MVAGRQVRAPVAAWQSTRMQARSKPVPAQPRPPPVAQQALPISRIRQVRRVPAGLSLAVERTPAVERMVSPREQPLVTALVLLFVQPGSQ